MKSKNLIPVQGVYSLDGWTQWNPLLSAENRPADISSVVLHMSGVHNQFHFLAADAGKRRPLFFHSPDTLEQKSN